jgi:hypothetical protein
VLGQPGHSARPGRPARRRGHPRAGRGRLTARAPVPRDARDCGPAPSTALPAASGADRRRAALITDSGANNG